MEKRKLVSRAELKQFIKENNLRTTEDVQSVLKDLFAETLQEMLEAEMDTTLGYEKNETQNKQTSNRRNGHSTKTVRSEYGEVDLAVPRDREGDFNPVIVKKHQKSVTGIEDQILALYAKGVSTRDIQDHLEQLYGVEVSPTLISNVTNKMNNPEHFEPLFRIMGATRPEADPPNHLGDNLLQYINSVKDAVAPLKRLRP